MAPRQRSRAPSLTPGAARHKAELQSKKPAYKILIEEVAQRRKKLLTLITHRKEAPAGYTFVAHGDTQTTNKCKTLARDAGAEVQIVSASNSRTAGLLATEVHRIGYHFPSQIVDKACNALGVRLSSAGHVINDHRLSVPIQQVTQPQMPQGSRKGQKNREILAEEVAIPLPVSQAEIDGEAKEAIRDLFPRIPPETLTEIIRHSFQKDTKKVGTADLPLTRRATLAVVAHIRHIHTDYDRLLRHVEWRQARQIVEPFTLDKLVEWRADKDENADGIDDILREVIILDDDEDDEVEATQESVRKTMEMQSHDQNRDSSVEIISSHVRAEDLQTEQINHHSVQRSQQQDFRMLTEPEPYGYGDSPRRSRRLQERTEAHRLQAWQDARSRRYHGPAARENPLIGQSHQESTRPSEPHTQQHPFQPNARSAFANGIIDLTSNSSPQKSDLRTTLPFGAFDGAEGMEKSHGRSRRLVPIDYRGHHGVSQHLTPVVTGNPYKLQDPSTPRSKGSEHVMLSVEDSPINHACPSGSERPFRGFRPVEEDQDYGDLRPHAVTSEVETAYATGKRRRVSGHEPSYVSRPYGSGGEYLPDRTVLVPLDQYEKHHGGNTLQFDPGYGGHLVGPVHGQSTRMEGHSVRHLDAGLVRRHDSIRAIVYEVPRHTGAEPPPERRPHFQVQLPPRSAVAHPQSPIATVLARSEYDQTLRSSYSDPSLFHPVAQHAYPAHGRSVDLVEDGRRRSERGVPTFMHLPPTSPVDHRSMFAMPDGREYPRYPETQLDHYPGRGFELPARTREIYTGVAPPRSGDPSTTVGAAFGPGNASNTWARTDTIDRYSFPSSMDNRATQEGLRPRQYHEGDPEHSSYSTMRPGHSERVLHVHDGRVTAHRPTHLAIGRPEAPITHPQYGPPGTRRNETSADVVILD